MIRMLQIIEKGEARGRTVHLNTMFFSGRQVCPLMPGICSGLHYETTWRIVILQAPLVYDFASSSVMYLWEEQGIYLSFKWHLNFFLCLLHIWGILLILLYPSFPTLLKICHQHTWTNVLSSHIPSLCSHIFKRKQSKAYFENCTHSLQSMQRSRLVYRIHEYMLYWHLYSHLHHWHDNDIL